MKKFTLSVRKRRESDECCASDESLLSPRTMLVGGRDEEQGSAG